MKRFIFDLDGTLLTANFEKEFDYFNNIYGEESPKILDNIVKYLDEYEKTHIRYDADILSRYLSKRSGLKFTRDIINGWNEVVGCISDTIEEDIVEVLEYLKSNNYSLAVLTNWFGIPQIKRLERANLLEYFDDIYTGEMVLKPHKDSYIRAKDRFSSNECIVIGDNVLKDYIAPRAVGMNSILYDKNDKENNNIVKIKRMNEIRNLY